MIVETKFHGTPLIIEYNYVPGQKGSLEQEYIPAHFEIISCNLINLEESIITEAVQEHWDELNEYNP